MNKCKECPLWKINQCSVIKEALQFVDRKYNRFDNRKKVIILKFRNVE